MKNVTKSLKNTLNESVNDGNFYERWENLKNVLGAEGFLSELFEAMDEDEIREDIEWIERMHDIEYDEDDEF